MPMQVVSQALIAAEHDGHSHQAVSHGSTGQVGQRFVGQREERCVFLNISISEKFCVLWQVLVVGLD